MAVLILCARRHYWIPLISQPLVMDYFPALIESLVLETLHPNTKLLFLKKVENFGRWKCLLRFMYIHKTCDKIVAQLVLEAHLIYNLTSSIMIKKKFQVQRTKKSLSNTIYDLKFYLFLTFPFFSLGHLLHQLILFQHLFPLLIFPNSQLIPTRELSSFKHQLTYKLTHWLTPFVSGCSHFRLARNNNWDPGHSDPPAFCGDNPGFS